MGDNSYGVLGTGSGAVVPYGCHIGPYMYSMFNQPIFPELLQIRLGPQKCCILSKKVYNAMRLLSEISVQFPHVFSYHGMDLS